MERSDPMMSLGMRTLKGIQMLVLQRTLKATVLMILNNPATNLSPQQLTDIDTETDCEPLTADMRATSELFTQIIRQDPLAHL